MHLKIICSLLWWRVYSLIILLARIYHHTILNSSDKGIPVEEFNELAYLFCTIFVDILTHSCAQM